MSGIRVRMVTAGQAPGPWAQWLATHVVGERIMLVVALAHADGGNRLDEWPLVGQRIEVNGQFLEQVQPFEELTG